MARQIESIVVMHLTKSRVVRVWRRETGLLKEYDNRDIKGVCIMNSEMPANKLAEMISGLSRVVDVEVVDIGGDGVRITSR